MDNKSNKRHTDCKFPMRMQSGQAGMTLIELMIVVVIVGVLAAVAVPALLKTTRKAQAAEVPAMFAEFKIRQQEFYAENGEFLATGASETTTFPASPSSPNQPNSITTIPAEWLALRIRLDKNALYCAYVALVGNAGTAPSGPLASTFGMADPPQTDWYYLLAYCDLDGNTAVNSVYFTSSTFDNIATQNPGR